ncbi:hypothetical protein PV458_09845, partial [Streptomyces sp. MN03-5084-2B]|nr:hypothetical protein [Streptomyces sp. MN03-5084-2B]
MRVRSMEVLLVSVGVSRRSVRLLDTHYTDSRRRRFKEFSAASAGVLTGLPGAVERQGRVRRAGVAPVFNK